MKLFSSLCIVLCLALSACSSRPKVNAAKIDWNSRIGNYTFNQAVAELGKPDSLSESSQGKAADWILRRSPNMSFGFGVGHSLYGSGVGTGVGVGTSVAPPRHGEYLHLIFDTEDKLKEWSLLRH